MKIVLSHRAYLKLRYFIQECPVEISGFGKARQVVDDDGNKAFRVYDLEVLPQTVGPASATIDDESLAKFTNEKIRKGIDMTEYRVWWHSHADFQAFFSGTDKDTIENLFTGFPFLISIVSNKAGVIVARYDEYHPQRYARRIREVVIEEKEDKRLLRQCKRAIGKKVRFEEERGYFARGLNLNEDEDITPRSPWLPKRLK